MKPYIFQNYEKQLPEKTRGYYKSSPADTKPVAPNQKEPMPGILLTVDLTNVVSIAPAKQILTLLW